MDAIIKSLELMVMALTATAFAHFGLAPKQSPCPGDHSARPAAIISASGAVASAAMQSVARRVP